MSVDYGQAKREVKGSSMQVHKVNNPSDDIDPGGEARRVVAIGMTIFVIFMLIGGAWLVFAPLSGAVIAQGIVKVEDNRKTVQHLEGGIVQSILVRDGDKVVAGQALLILADTLSRAGSDLLTDQLHAELSRQARLEAEARLADAVTYPASLARAPSGSRAASLVQGENALFAARKRNLEGQLSMLVAQIKQIDAEVAGLQAQIKFADQGVGFLNEQIEAYEALHKQGFIQKVRMLDLQRTLADKQEAKGEYQAGVATALQKMAELKLRSNSLRDIYVQEAARDLEETRRRIPDLQTRLIPAQDAIERLTVRAPVAGQVMGLRVHTVGGVVAPREPLLEIVPTERRLIVEARVLPMDVDDVVIGQEVDVRLSAFKQRNLPYSIGVVESLSDDVISDPQAQLAYYLARVVLNPDSVFLPPGKILVPGMPAESYIKTGKRTPFHYLMDSVEQTLSRAGKEP